MTNQPQNYSEESFNVIELIKILWHQKFLIISITLMFAVFSVFYALSLPNKYESSPLLTVTEDGSQSSGGGLSALASQYGGLASMAGLSIPSSSLNRGIYATKIIKSREFAKHLMSFDLVKAKLMATDSYDAGSGKIIYDSKIYDQDKNIWLRKQSGKFESEPTYLEVHGTALKALEVNRNEETGLIMISFEHLSPVFAQEVVSLVIREANKVTREIKLKESTAAMTYLQRESKKVTSKDLKANINMLIQQQLNEKMLASIKDDFLVTTIDPPVIPVYKSSPKRARICILITLLGGMLSIFTSLIKYNLFRES